jgi:hypothetical protein
MSLSEIVFVRQARREIGSLRQSLRSSVNTQATHPAASSSFSTPPPQELPKRGSSGRAGSFSSNGWKSRELSFDRSCDFNVMDYSFRTGSASSQLAPVQEGDREDSMQFCSKSVDESCKEDDDSHIDGLFGRRVKNAGVMSSINEVQEMDRSNQDPSSTQGESSSRDDAHELHMLHSEVEQGPSTQMEEWFPTERIHAPCGLDTSSPSHERPSTERSSRPEDHDIGKDGVLRDMEAGQDLPPPLEASTMEGFPGTEFDHDSEVLEEEDVLLSSGSSRSASRATLNTDISIEKVEAMERNLVEDVGAAMKDIEAKFRNADDVADNNLFQVED